MRLLNQAFAAGDDTGFEHALQELNAIRRPDLATGMQRVSQLLLGALTRFRSESRIATLATKDVPGARLRLDHVLHITADAANRTIDIIERLGPLTEATARDAAQLAGSLDPSHAGVVGFLAGVQDYAGQVRRDLTEVLLAQGFQDLTGQILCSVRTLVDEIESILQELAASAGVNLSLATCDGAAGTLPQGPSIPGLTAQAVTDQDDVDDLIARLGI